MNLRFKKKVRAFLEGKGWKVITCNNTVELEPLGMKNKKMFFKGQMVNLKRFSFEKAFPDFIAYAPLERTGPQIRYEIYGIVCEQGELDTMQRVRAAWLIEHKYFQRLLIVGEGENGLAYTPFQ